MTFSVTSFSDVCVQYSVRSAKGETQPASRRARLPASGGEANVALTVCSAETAPQTHTDEEKSDVEPA